MIGITCFTSRAKVFKPVNRTKNPLAFPAELKPFSLSSWANSTPGSPCLVKTSLQSQQLNRFSFPWHVAYADWPKAAVRPSSYFVNFEQFPPQVFATKQNKPIHFESHHTIHLLSSCSLSCLRLHCFAFCEACVCGCFLLPFPSSYFGE